jgi:hypothetical protein
MRSPIGANEKHIPVDITSDTGIIPPQEPSDFQEQAT